MTYQQQEIETSKPYCLLLQRWSQRLLKLQWDTNYEKVIAGTSNPFNGSIIGRCGSRSIDLYLLIMDGKTTFKIGYFKSMATTINGYGNQLFSMYLLTLCFKSELLIKRCIHIAHFNLLGFQQDSYNKQLQYFRLKFSTCNQLFILPLFHWSNTF